jgi:hypothetical protein
MTLGPLSPLGLELDEAIERQKGREGLWQPMGLSRGREQGEALQTARGQPRQAAGGQISTQWMEAVDDTPNGRGFVDR